MRDFAEVLSVLEAQHAGDAASLARRRRIRSFLPLSERPASMAAARTRAHDVYGEYRRPPERLTLHSFMKDLDRARRSDKALRSLRRQVARALHPDWRNTKADADLLGRCNALIDAALKELGARP